MRLLGGGGGSSGPVDWLVVGLGNPGERYARTPHNVGFAVAEALAARWDLARPRQRYAGLFTEGRTGPGGPRVAVLRPQTYMNEAAPPPPPPPRAPPPHPPPAAAAAPPPRAPPPPRRGAAAAAPPRGPLVAPGGPN